MLQKAGLQTNKKTPRLYNVCTPRSRGRRNLEFVALVAESAALGGWTWGIWLGRGEATQGLEDAD